MEITRKTSTEFKPIVLEIVIRTKEEKKVLREMFGFTQSIPAMLKDNGCINIPEEQLLNNLMQKFYKYI